MVERDNPPLTGRPRCLDIKIFYTCVHNLSMCIKLLEKSRNVTWSWILKCGHLPSASANKQNNMKITLVNSLSHRDYWYNLQKMYNFYSLFQKYCTFIYFKNISKSKRTAFSTSHSCVYLFYIDSKRRMHEGLTNESSNERKRRSILNNCRRPDKTSFLWHDQWGGRVDGMYYKTCISNVVNVHCTWDLPFLGYFYPTGCLSPIASLGYPFYHI
jgi:hypothetical protein